jgi:GntR family transcriptional regulator, transcriptional repressor for pyruvate dehydrogenase complex
MKDLKIESQTVTLVDQVEEKLLNYFRSNKLKPGDAIPREQDLAEALGVARSVLREALSRLRMLGLVESRTRRGMVLREPYLLGGLQRVLDPEILGDETLFNLLGFRVALELGICDCIFDNLTDRHIMELKSIVRKGVMYENNLYLPVSEHQFHSKLYEITGNHMIMQFQEIIYPVSVFVRNKFKVFFEPINKELKKHDGLVTHHELFIYLKNRDREGFRTGIIKHFSMYNQFVTNKKSLQPTS